VIGAWGRLRVHHFRVGGWFALGPENPPDPTDLSILLGILSPGKPAPGKGSQVKMNIPREAAWLPGWLIQGLAEHGLGKRRWDRSGRGRCWRLDVDNYK
jgi:hypothetical protein